MSFENHIGALRQSKGWSRPKLAALMGTSPQQLERLEKGQRKLSPDWISRAAAALGVAPGEIVSFVDDPSQPAHSEAKPLKYEGPSLERMREDLPMYGTALGAPRIYDGEAVEQTTLNTGDVVRYLKRPVILNDRPDAYGLTVVGNSMWPVYPEGTTVIAETKRHPRVGDDVIVYLRSKDEDGDDRARAVLIKRLVRRSASYVELQQFTPAHTFRLDTDEVLRIDRVMTLDDLLS